MNNKSKIFKFGVLILVIFGLFPISGSASGSVEPVGPCVDLEKTGPLTAMPGETITYHFLVNNCGDTYLGGGVQVYDPLLSKTESYECWNCIQIDSIYYTPFWMLEMEAGTTAELDMTYTLPEDKCGPFENNALAIGTPPWPDPKVEDYSSWTINIICNSPGTGTPGYWKNHPEAWPDDEITIGGMVLTKDEAIDYMMMPVKGDKTKTMFPALVSAKLNGMIGNDDSCISDTITDADMWMSHHPVGSGVKANSMWKHGEPLYERLDNYNNGYMCAPPRD